MVDGFDVRFHGLGVFSNDERRMTIDELWLSLSEA
jgi:hypothetical protein